MSELLRNDLRSAFRHGRRRPALAIAVTLTLAAVIGAATTAVGLASAVLWRPLPFADASRLVFVWEEVGDGAERAPARVTGSRHAAWRDASGDLFSSSIALFAASSFTMDTAEGAVSVRGVRVSAGYFDTLGISAALGRTLQTPSRSGSEGNHSCPSRPMAMGSDRSGGQPSRSEGARRARDTTLVLSGEISRSGADLTFLCGSPTPAEPRCGPSLSGRTQASCSVSRMSWPTGWLLRSTFDFRHGSGSASATVHERRRSS